MATRLSRTEQRRFDRIFYTGAAAVSAGLILVGFARSWFLSFWFQPPPGTPAIGPLLAVHGAIFTSWLALSVVQPSLIAGQQPRLHRRLGYVGAGLAALMVVFGNLAAVAAIHVGFIGLGDPYSFYAIPFFDIQAFGICVLLAVLWRNRAETHKRLMLLSSVPLLEAGLARVPIAAFQATLPYGSVYASNAVVLAGVIYDLMTRGRVHPAWIWGGLAMIFSNWLRLAIWQSEARLSFAHMIGGAWPH